MGISSDYPLVMVKKWLCGEIIVMNSEFHGDVIVGIVGMTIIEKMILR